MNELTLYGSVGFSWWEEEYFTAAEVREKLSRMSGDVTVRINSGGGVATEGQAIYTALKDYPGKVTVVVDGVAASAASLIAMAGDVIRMRLGAWMLIHDPSQMWTNGRGTEEEHRQVADLLNVVGDAYAEIYADRSGLSKEEARAVMRAETVMDGEKAIDLGFADERDGQAAVPEAAFDYRIYANAPAHLRQSSERLGKAPEKAAVMAMFAGSPRITLKQKESVMDPKTKPVADVTPPAPTPAVPHAPTPAPVADAASTEAAIRAERDRVSRIMATAKMAGTPDLAEKLIADGVSFDDAHRQLINAWAGGADDKPRPGAPTARILRDERDTMRMAMGQALVAQLARSKPESDAAQPYMQHSIVEMAAEAIAHRGPLRTAFERQEVLASAFHTTSDFPAIFENALNKRLIAGYTLATPIYTKISIRQDFTDFRPHPMVNTGSMPLLLPVNEKGEIKYGTVGEKKETVALIAYAIAVGISRQMVINDDLGAIDRLLTTQGAAVARTEESVFFAMLLSGTSANGPTLNENSRQVFNTTDATLAGSGAAISVTSLAAGRAAIQKHKGINNEDLALSPKILLCGPDKLTEAEQIIAPIQALEAGKVNPFSGMMGVESTPKITGNAWYLLTDPSVQAQFMHGFLAGDAGPRMRMDEPFGVQGVRFSIERDFGVGAIDWRGAWKNPGA
jgi:ATP-dependent protease ClpP protease subunit